MREEERLINDIMSDVFNDILRVEELSITKAGYSNLTVKEMHVIEAAYKAQRGDNSATGIAKRLGVTPGTLTISVTQLEKKGYVSRIRDEEDKRVVRITVTDKGKAALQKHDDFHMEMVEEAIKALSPREREALTSCLFAVSDFLKGKYKGAYNG